MEQIFLKKKVEHEITGIQHHIDDLLDLRNLMQEPDIRKQIDSRLGHLTHRLFTLEA
jgi:hypothetical protein